DDFGHHHSIVRVIDESVWPAADKGGLRKYDDTRRPALAERGEDPQAADLDQEEQRKPQGLDRLAGGQPPQGQEPARVEGDDQRVMTRPVLACALAKEPPRVSVRKPQLTQALERNERKDGNIEDHGASSIRPAQVKPGPNAVISTLSGRPRSSSRSSTNITVGALMLP